MLADVPGHLSSNGQVFLLCLVQLMAGAEVILVQLSKLHLALDQFLKNNTNFTPQFQS